jgi:hypothetical protein
MPLSELNPQREPSLPQPAGKRKKSLFSVAAEKRPGRGAEPEAEKLIDCRRLPGTCGGEAGRPVTALFDALT